MNYLLLKFLNCSFFCEDEREPDDIEQRLNTSLDDIIQCHNFIYEDDEEEGIVDVENEKKERNTSKEQLDAELESYMNITHFIRRIR